MSILNFSRQEISRQEEEGPSWQRKLRLSLKEERPVLCMEVDRSCFTPSGYVGA